MTDTSLEIGSHRLVFSADQWVVERKTNPDHHKAKKGGGGWKQVSFHNRLSYALSWVMDKEIGLLGDPHKRTGQLLQAVDAACAKIIDAYQDR